VRQRVETLEKATKRIRTITKQAEVPAPTPPPPEAPEEQPTRRATTRSPKQPKKTTKVISNVKTKAIKPDTSKTFTKVISAGKPKAITKAISTAKTKASAEPQPDSTVTVVRKRAVPKQIVLGPNSVRKKANNTEIPNAKRIRKVAK
jgi:hypothetical protein